MVSASNVKGQTSKQASALVDDAATDAFLATIDKRFADEVRAAAKAVQVPAGSTLFGAVASVGCEEPTSITWQTTFDGVEVRATLPKPGVQCLVPVTSIALFLVPAARIRPAAGSSGSAWASAARSGWAWASGPAWASGAPAG